MNHEINHPFGQVAAAGWKRVRVAAVAEVASGVGFPMAHQGQQQGTFPFYKVSDMNLPGNEVHMRTHNNAVSNEVRQKLRAKAFPAGSVIFPKIGAAIATNKKRILTRPSCADNNVMAIVPRQDLLMPEFLYYIMTRKNLSDFASDSNPPSIRKTVVEEWEIPLPSLDEQRRIVDILNHAASIRRLREEARAKAREVIPALFVDMFGDPATNPKGWEMATVRDVLNRPIRNGISPSRAGRIPASVLTLSAITRAVFDDSAVKEAMFATAISIDDEVDQRDFLICRGNGNPDLVGRGAFPNRSMPGIAFPDTAMALRPDPLRMLPTFLAGVWQSPFVRQQIVSSARTTNGTYKVNQNGIGSIRLPVPPLALQQEFAERVAEVQGISTLNDRAATAAEQMAQSLLAQVFGQAA